MIGSLCKWSKLLWKFGPLHTKSIVLRSAKLRFHIIYFEWVVKHLVENCNSISILILLIVYHSQWWLIFVFLIWILAKDLGIIKIVVTSHYVHMRCSIVLLFTVRVLFQVRQSKLFPSPYGFVLWLVLQLTTVDNIFQIFAISICKSHYFVIFSNFLSLVLHSFGINTPINQIWLFSMIVVSGVLCSKCSSVWMLVLKQHFCYRL